MRWIKTFEVDTHVPIPHNSISHSFASEKVCQAIAFMLVYFLFREFSRRPTQRVSHFLTLAILHPTLQLQRLSIRQAWQSTLITHSGTSRTSRCRAKMSQSRTNLVHV